MEKKEKNRALVTPVVPKLLVDYYHLIHPYQLVERK